MQIEAHPVDADFAPVRYGDSGITKTRVTKGRFRIPGLFGARRFVVSGVPEGYYLKSLTVNGSDVTDQAVDFGVGGPSTAAAEVVISGNGASIVGRITGRTNVPAGSAVVVFPRDRENWFATSRFIKTVRPLRDGSFRAASLPPGEYYVSLTSIADESMGGMSRDSLERLLPRAAKVTLNEADAQSVEIPLPVESPLQKR